MNVDTVVRYWLETAEEDWPVAEHLLASGDYRYALFFGHLYLEKLLKETTGFKKRAIITDSVFSMDGDVAPLDEVQEHVA